MNNESKHINFIESTERIKNIQFELNYLLIVRVMFVLFAIGASFTLMQRYRIGWANKRVVALNAELDTAKSQHTTLTSKNDSSGALDTALGNPIYWTPLLKKITRNTPQGIQFAQVVASLKDNRGVSLRGFAADVQLVSKFKNRLATIEECAQATLVEVGSQQNTDGTSQIGFQVSCGVK